SAIVLGTDRVGLHEVSSYLSFSFLFCCAGDHRHLHSFPTRRSSDLSRSPRKRPTTALNDDAAPENPDSRLRLSGDAADCAPSPRSEEHTSELQSRSDLVCRLLLEKKNYHSPSMIQSGSLFRSTFTRQ